MDTEPKLVELPIPPPALADAAAVEMVRAWIANHQVHASLKVGLWDETPNVDEEQVWGRILADLARMIATALEGQHGGSRQEIVERLWHHLGSELAAAPGSGYRGEFID